MYPNREKVVHGVEVKQYYWAGKHVVYIDHQLSEQTFDEACAAIEERHNKSLKSDGRAKRRRMRT